MAAKAKHRRKRSIAKKKKFAKTSEKQFTILKGATKKNREFGTFIEKSKNASGGSSKHLTSHNSIWAVRKK